jgi:putative transposase
MRRAYRFALDPNDRQRSALASHCGAARFAFNWGLGLVKERLEGRESGSGARVPWSLPELRREWNRAKAEVAPWWAENSKEAYSSGLDALARALSNFSASKRGQRRGRRMGFPGFRKRGRRDRSRFTTGAIRVDDERHVVLPRLGRLKTLEATTALEEEIGAGRARILAATISREAERWFVSFTVEVERELLPSNGHQDTVGVDVGLLSLATLSTGEKVAGPKGLRRNLRKLRRLSRALSRKRRGSANRRRAARKLGRSHARVANLRHDHLHKLSTTLAKSHGRVALEDLNISGMLGNRRLARAIADAGWGELRRMLEYKCRWYGSELVVVDRWYPSSKVCSECGAVKTELLLSATDSVRIEAVFGH